jgi:hypothetical protein
MAASFWFVSQERFVAKVARYERLPVPRFFTGRSQQREAERQTEMLVQSLLSQSFGEIL